MEEIDLSDTEQTHKQQEEEKGADFDEISNDLGSENEGMPDMDNRLNQVKRNDHQQANKSAFANEVIIPAQPELNISQIHHRQSPVVQRENPNPLEDLINSNQPGFINPVIKQEVRDLMEMFPEHDPVVLQDLLDQLNGNKELVIECLMNGGQISQRILRQLQQEDQRRQQPEESAFASPSQQQRQHQRDANHSDHDEGFDQDAEFARRLQQRELERVKKEERMIQEQKQIEAQIRKETLAQRSTSQRRDIPNMYELRQSQPNENQMDINSSMDSNRQQQPQNGRRQMAKMQQPQKQAQQNGIKIRDEDIPREQGNFFSNLCKCFQSNNQNRPKKDKKKQSNSEENGFDEIQQLDDDDQNMRRSRKNQSSSNNF